MMNTLFNEVLEKLINAKIDSPRLETRLIFAHVLNKNASDIFQNIEMTISQKKAILSLVDKRVLGHPLDKLLGHKEFYKYDFIVDENVLSPRPDTEILVEEAINIIKNKNLSNIIDLGTGSGCIILSILKDCPLLKGVAIDISEKALEIAKENAKKLDLTQNIKFIKSNWFDKDFLNHINAKFDIIVTNPPYIPSDDIQTLSEEVKNHDPLLALDGGKNGFYSYEKIAEIAPALLNNGGYICIEAGINQADNIAKIFMNKGLIFYKIVKDLSGIDRCVILQKPIA